MIDAVTDVFASLSFVEATVAVLVLAIVAGILVEVIVLRGGRHLVGRTESTIDDIVFQTLRIPVIVSVGLAAVYLLTRSPAVSEATVGREALDVFFGRPALTLMVVIWAWALNGVVNRTVEEVADAGPRYAFAPIFSNVWTLAVIVGAGFTILSLWRIQITPLLGAAGVAGIAIGFAAKDTVANFFGGVALYVDDTYKIGDYVILDSGEAGTVVKVGIRSTTLLTRSEVLVTVPNSVLNAAKVTNASAPQRRKRISVPIGVAYGTDLDEFESLVLDIADEESLVLESPKPRMRFRRFGDSALEYDLLCWVRNPTRENKAKHELNRAIYAVLAHASIEIPFPKRDVMVRNGTEPDGATPDDPRRAADGAEAGEVLDELGPHDAESSRSVLE